jgi:CRISPR-associated protein Csd2
MTVRGLWVFTHDKAYGSAPAHRLFDLIRVTKKPGIDVCRDFSDYQVEVLADELPAGVALESLV